MTSKSLFAWATVIGLFAAVTGRAEVTPGFDFFVDAGQDTDGDQYWEDLTAGNPTGSDLLLDDAPAIARVSVSGSSTQFTHAYEFPGGQPPGRRVFRLCVARRDLACGVQPVSQGSCAVELGIIRNKSGWHLASQALQ